MNTLRSLWRTYGKGIVAALIAAYTVVQAAISDGRVTTVEGVQIAIATVTAIGVYVLPQHPQADWVKTTLAVLLAILGVVATAIVQGWSWNELILAALTALGVSLSPAQSTVPAVPLATVER